MDEESEAGFKPPYGSFRTFWGFIDSLGEKPLPPRIDRSMFEGKSGTDQFGLLMALRSFELVAGAEQRVEPALAALCAGDADARKVQLAGLIRRYYPEQIRISDEHGTEKMLLDSFETVFGLNGDTRRKAATWFLHAAKEGGLTLSSHFPKVRSGPGAPAGSRTRRTVRRKAADSQKGQTSGTSIDPQVGGDEFTVKLRAGGTVTLRVNVGHFALSRNKVDREFVQALMDALTSYEEASPRAVPEPVVEGGGDAPSVGSDTAKPQEL